MALLREKTNNASPLNDDIPTALAAGILAATLAAVIHETLGHGIGCLTDGGTITVLTSIWFRCQGAASLTVAAGPAASLAAGLVTLLLLRRWTLNGAMRLTIMLSAAFNLFWFAGQLIFHAITNGDTWAIMARMQRWPVWWRPVSAALGAVCYIAATRAIIRTQTANRKLNWGAILAGYAAGTISAFLAGLMWAPMPIRSALEGPAQTMSAVGCAAVKTKDIRRLRLLGRDDVRNLCFADGIAYSEYKTALGRNCEQSCRVVRCSSAVCLLGYSRSVQIPRTLNP